MEPSNEPAALPAGWQLAVALLAASRAFIEEAHDHLADMGYPGARPAYGYVLQLVSAGCWTASDLAERLGISSQGVGQMIDEMEAAGYIRRIVDKGDRRRRRLVVAPRGRELLERSASAFDQVRDRWARLVGAERLSALDADMRALGGGDGRMEVLRPLW